MSRQFSSVTFVIIFITLIHKIGPDSYPGRPKSLIDTFSCHSFCRRPLPVRSPMQERLTGRADVLLPSVLISSSSTLRPPGACWLVAIKLSKPSLLNSICKTNAMYVDSSSLYWVQLFCFYLFNDCSWFLRYF